MSSSFCFLIRFLRRFSKLIKCIRTPIVIGIPIKPIFNFNKTVRSFIKKPAIVVDNPNAEYIEIRVNNNVGILNIEAAIIYPP